MPRLLRTLGPHSTAHRLLLAPCIAALHALSAGKAGLHVISTCVVHQPFRSACLPLPGASSTYIRLDLRNVIRQADAGSHVMHRPFAQHKGSPLHCLLMCRDAQQRLPSSTFLGTFFSGFTTLIALFFLHHTSRQALNTARLTVHNTRT